MSSFKSLFSIHLLCGLFCFISNFIVSLFPIFTIMFIGVENTAPELILWTRRAKPPFLPCTHGQSQSLVPPKKSPPVLILENFDQSFHPFSPSSLVGGDISKECVGTGTHVLFTHQLLSEVCFWSNCTIYFYVVQWSWQTVLTISSCLSTPI